MLIGLFSSALMILASAAESDDIKEEIDELKKQAEALEEKKDDLDAEIEANDLEKAGYIAQKSAIDREMNLTIEQIANTEALIEMYDLLIAEKQSDLLEAQNNEAALYETYKEHIRYLEEHGAVTYIAILFNAGSFSDFLNRLDWIRSISAADELMMEELAQATEEIRAAQDALFEAEAEIEEQKTTLEAQKAVLDEQSAEAQVLIDQYAQQTDEMQQVQLQYDAMMDLVYDEIAAKQKEYEAAKAAEEEEARKAAAAAAAAAGNKNNGGSSSGGSSTGGSSSGGSNSGSSSAGGSYSGSFIWPVSGGYITSPYGMRMHPVYGYEKMHYGIDIGGLYTGAPVYATASGTVTLAGWDDSAGNWIMISHSGGYASAYMHLSGFAVKYGQYVSQGQLIGYVGSTGASTGPHLHFAMYYNGCFINPSNYVG